MADDTNNKPLNTYELKLRILGNEVFAVGVSASSEDNKWIAIGIVSVFSILTVLGAYGEKIISLYHHLVG